MGTAPIHSVGSRVIAKNDTPVAGGDCIINQESRSPLASTDIKFYAIRQKSTGCFLPHHYGSKRVGTISYTHDEPQPNTLPRPFKTEVTARIALTAWLKGVWSQTVESVYDSCYDPPEHVYMPSPPDRPNRSRKPADMEVVEIRLGSIRPIP